MVYVVRLWDVREPYEGVRLGAVRYPPRGKTKEEIAELYDVWMPELAPSRELLRESPGRAGTAWGPWSRRYLREMRSPACRHLIAFLARISSEMNLSVGCYCTDFHRCHRSLLHRLLIEAGAMMGTRVTEDGEVQDLVMDDGSDDLDDDGEPIEGRRATG